MEAAERDTMESLDWRLIIFFFVFLLILILFVLINLEHHAWPYLESKVHKDWLMCHDVHGIIIHVHPFLHKHSTDAKLNHFEKSQELQKS